MKKTSTSSLKVNNQMKQLAENLIIARKRRGISISEIASRLNVTRATIYRLEGGDLGVSLGTYLEYLNQVELLDGIGIATDPSLDISVVENEVRAHRKANKKMASLPTNIDLDF